ncbi:SDR family NAD(P)-dependent oxidoreductase [Actinomadura sp. 1N219]|uniref:SDR family NAD(P)-dependent oxidoreductase n=1 Tax=Actinomadura sp. 1N219 TaxID=3375152 RepID=UPI0037962E38
MTDLGGRTVLVTGCNGRIGRAIVRLLLDSGARVGGADLGETTSIPEGDDFRYTSCDVSDADSVEEAVTRLEDALGRFDGLVNSHGYYPNLPLTKMTVEEWDRVFAVNARGSMLTTRAMLLRWIERGAAGSIVNISSCAATSPRTGGSHYSGSKAAVNSLTAVTAIEGGPHGIRANAIQPGLVLDEVQHKGDEGLHPYFALQLDLTPLGRTGAPDDIAHAAAFLLSDASAWTTGAVIDISGGSHAGRTQMPETSEMR